MKEYPILWRNLNNFTGDEEEAPEKGGANSEKGAGPGMATTHRRCKIFLKPPPFRESIEQRHCVFLRIVSGDEEEVSETDEAPSANANEEGGGYPDVVGIMSIKPCPYCTTGYVSVSGTESTLSETRPSSVVPGVLSFQT
jgi:hypothetical protein